MGLPHSKTLACCLGSKSLRQVLECGSPMPLSFRKRHRFLFFTHHASCIRFGMAEYHFKTPLRESDVRQLRVGDSVLLDGIVFGIRDANMIRVFDERVAPPVDWRGAALLHTAPNVRKV